MKCRFCGGYYALQIIGRHEEICPKNPSTALGMPAGASPAQNASKSDLANDASRSLDDMLKEKVLALEKYVKEIDDRMSEKTNEAKVLLDITRNDLSNEAQQKIAEVQQEIRSAHSKIDNLQHLVQTYLGGQLELATTLRKTRAGPIAIEPQSAEKQGIEEEILASVPERFRKPYIAITKVLAGNPEKLFTVSELAQRANYRPKGGSFRQTMALIKRNKIVLPAKDPRKNLTMIRLNPDVKTKIIQVVAAEQSRNVGMVELIKKPKESMVCVSEQLDRHDENFDGTEGKRQLMPQGSPSFLLFALPGIFFPV
jgi:hypothetical protein